MSTWLPALTAAISVMALATSVAAWRTARHNVSTKVLVDMFNEHRSEHLARARRSVYRELVEIDPASGISGLPEDIRPGVRDLAWFYDNLGVLVHHGVVDIRPISGYLGGSVVSTWQVLEPFIATEREKRSDSPDPARWQMYFELLVDEIAQMPPDRARRPSLWRRLRTKLRRTNRGALKRQKMGVNNGGA